MYRVSIEYRNTFERTRNAVGTRAAVFPQLSRVYDHYYHYYSIYNKFLDRDWLSNHNREFRFAACFLKAAKVVNAKTIDNKFQRINCVI